MTPLEKAARALTECDAEFGYSLQLTWLVDGVSTYTLTLSDGTPPVELSYDEGQEIIAHKKSLILARAVISSIEIDDAMLTAAVNAGDEAYWGAVHDEKAMEEAFTAAIKAALRSILEDGAGQ